MVVMHFSPWSVGQISNADSRNCMNDGRQSIGSALASCPASVKPTLRHPLAHLCSQTLKHTCALCSLLPCPRRRPFITVLPSHGRWKTWRAVSHCHLASSRCCCCWIILTTERAHSFTLPRSTTPASSTTTVTKAPYLEAIDFIRDG
jgi:hypothetical protein